MDSSITAFPLALGMCIRWNHQRRYSTAGIGRRQAACLGGAEFVL